MTTAIYENHKEDKDIIGISGLKVQIQKILFLDVDGVLNDNEIRQSISMEIMRPIFVKRLEKILKETDCNIVISSTWSIFGMEEKDPFYKALRTACYDLDSNRMKIDNPKRYEFIKSKVIGETKKCDSFYQRGYEINSWIENFYCEKEQEGLKYLLVIAIVDDNFDMEPYRHCLVNTKDDFCDDSGLTEEKMVEIIEMLSLHPRNSFPTKNFPNMKLEKLAREYDELHKK
jgi:hypothetical protein